HEAWFNAPWVNNLKLRASYGSSGNRPNSLYPHFNLYSLAASASYNGAPGALISQIGNPNLTWEKTLTAGVGLDAAFFNNRLRATIDYYHQNTDNIRYNVPSSGVTRVTSNWRVIGQTRTRGLEVSVGGDIL